MTRPTLSLFGFGTQLGSFDLGSTTTCARWLDDARRGAPNLLNHLTRNGLSATWAIVGAMIAVRFLTFPRFRSPLSALLAPLFQLRSKDGDDPLIPNGSERACRTDPNATPAQEIGSIRFHTFFAQRGMTPERAIAEYRFVQLRMNLNSGDTFIFPRNL